MTDREKKYFYDKISLFRKGLQMLEEELGRDLEPAKPKRMTMKQLFRQQCINQYELGDRRMIPELKERLAEMKKKDERAEKRKRQPPNL